MNIGIGFLVCKLNWRAKLFRVRGAFIYMHVMTNWKITSSNLHIDLTIDHNLFGKYFCLGDQYIRRILQRSSKPASFPICSNAINIWCPLRRHTSARLQCRWLIQLWCKSSFCCFSFGRICRSEIQFVTTRSKFQPDEFVAFPLLSRLFPHNITLIRVGSTWSILMLKVASFTFYVWCFSGRELSNQGIKKKEKWIENMTLVPPSIITSLRYLLIWKSFNENIVHLVK